MRNDYESPVVVLTQLDTTDIVRTSPGDNYAEDDFPAFSGN